jgi:hypothetical protein
VSQGNAAALNLASANALKKQRAYLKNTKFEGNNNAGNSTVRFAGILAMEGCNFTNGEREVGDVAGYSATDKLFTDDMTIDSKNCEKLNLTDLDKETVVPGDELPRLKDSWISNKRQVILLYSLSIMQ